MIYLKANTLLFAVMILKRSKNLSFSLSRIFIFTSVLLFTFSTSVHAQSNSLDTIVGNPVGGPAGNIIWLNSIAPQEFNGYGGGYITAQCAEASLAEIFNAYSPLNSDGSPKYTIYDVEKDGLSNGTWDTYWGLKFQPTWHDSLQTQANDFGFKVAWYKDYGLNPTDANLNEILTYVDQGHPVMIDAYLHWYVLYGHDASGQTLYTLDASRHDYTVADSKHVWPPGPAQNNPMPRSLFLGGFWWQGLAAVIEPK